MKDRFRNERQHKGHTPTGVVIGVQGVIQRVIPFFSEQIQAGR